MSIPGGGTGVVCYRLTQPKFLLSRIVCGMLDGWGDTHIMHVRAGIWRVIMGEDWSVDY